MLVVFYSSCIDEISVDKKVEGAFISITGITPMIGTDPGSPEDYLVSSLRVLAFNRSNGACVSNIRYNEGEWTDNVLRYSIAVGNYDFVFLANEPEGRTLQQMLDLISTYDDLNNIAYPANAFMSSLNIPMMQEIKDVTVLPKGEGLELEDGTQHSFLKLALNRLGVRVDVVLEAEDDFEAVFTGVVFSNIPDLVPLTANYSGSIGRSIIRKFTLSENGSYFSDGTPSAVGITWAKNINRIILPSSEPVDKSEKSEAVVFTVNMGTNYNPSCELEINSNPVDYSLPMNSKLDLTGIIRDALHVNVKASDWSEYDGNWIISGNKKLNVSHTQVCITDFNGARISFWSNMPEVKVLPEVFIGTSTVTAETESIFNDLVLKDIDVTDNGTTVTYATSRFSYTYDKVSESGFGYMDILLDEQNAAGENTYRIILSAEDEYGGKLQKEIEVKTSQYGGRYAFTEGTRYVGAFYRKNETGERVVTGQQERNNDLPEYGGLTTWKATVIDGDFVVLSTTPSFDPGIGTYSPGNPEKYPVTPNEYKGESGRMVEGRGRIYFRIGLNSTHSGDKPRYALVLVERYGGTWGGGYWTYKDSVFIRQGEDPDYILRAGTEDAITSGQLQGQPRNAARMFSPFNLTAPEFKNGGEAANYQVGHKNGVFVKYPSQAGAFFQWGLPDSTHLEPYFRQAYHPVNPVIASYWNKTLQFLTTNSRLFLPVWNTATGIADPIYDYGYKDIFEICPEGYHRPSDGYTDRISWNGLYPNMVKYVNGVKVGTAYVDVFEKQKDTIAVDHGEDIAYSEWRQSLFKNPLAGDAARLENIGGWDGSSEKNGIKIDREPNFWQDPNDTEEAKRHITFAFGFYADGYFDRLPVIKKSEYSFGVSVDNAQVAYRGILVYNKDNENASVFFPSAGRRASVSGQVEFSGSTGYYQSSSIGPYSANTPQSVWSISLGKWPNPGLYYQLPTFAESARCVRDETFSRSR